MKELFDESEIEKSWQKEWVGMPEFIQQKASKPFHQIVVRFASQEDMLDFSKIISQKITSKTKSIWHPQIERGVNANKIYVDESEISDIHNKQG